MSDTATDLTASTTVQSAVSSDAMPASLSASLSALTRGELSEATAGLISDVLVPAGTALVLLVVTYFVAQWISRSVTATVCKRIDQTLGKFAGKFIYYTILTLAVLTIMQTFGFQSASLAAVMAATGFAIGLAFQGTLSNFASGILLLVFRPFKVGDLVNAAGVLGKVNEIDLFTTTLDTPDNRRLIIPNSSIASGTIENVTHHAHRRVEVSVGVAYSASLEETRGVLTACAKSLSELMISGENRGYQVVLTNLGASSVEWTVRFWAATGKYLAVKEALTTEIKQRLDDSGIVIPFPQMQLHLSNADDLALKSIHAASEDALPIPKMSIATTEKRLDKIRPRARGGL